MSAIYVNNKAMNKALKKALKPFRFKKKPNQVLCNGQIVFEIEPSSLYEDLYNVKAKFYLEGPNDLELVKEEMHYISKGSLLKMDAIICVKNEIA